MISAASATVCTRVAEFCDAVRQRYQRCVIYLRAFGAVREMWNRYGRALKLRTFPLPACIRKGHWRQHNYSRWITVPPSTGSISSVQNGIPIFTSFSMVVEVSIHLDGRTPDGYGTS